MQPDALCLWDCRTGKRGGLEKAELEMTVNLGSDLQPARERDTLSESSGFGGTMCAGMSRSTRHVSREPWNVRGRDVRTVVRYLARDVLEAIDRVDYFEVMLRHV